MKELKCIRHVIHIINIINSVKWKKYIFVLCIVLVYISISILSSKKLVCRDEYFDKQWYLDDRVLKNSQYISDTNINILPFWSKRGYDNEVIVAIIDTGIDVNHEDLKNNIWNNTNEIPFDGIDNDQNGYIDDINGWNMCENNNELLSGEEIYENDHGTACAGIIIAEHNQKGIAGISNKDNIKVMSIKVLKGLEHEGTVDDLINGIHYAENMGAQICNLSLELEVNDFRLQQVMQKSDMLFIVAAGNGGYDIDKEKRYPASYKLNNMISVCDISIDGELSESSNYGKESVDIAAPGTDIYSTCVGGYAYESGSSMATAMVTGAAAVLYSYNYGKHTPYYIKKIICDSVNYNQNLKDKVKSGGILDIGQCIKRIEKGVCENE